MKLNTILILVSLLLITSLSLVSSQPPLTTIILDRGVDIVHPETQIVENGVDLEFNFWTYNSSSGETLTNETLNCTLYIINDEGIQFFKFSNLAGSSGLITYGKGAPLCLNCWTSILPAENITIGGYSYQIKCQSQTLDIGGYTVGSFEVTPTGKVIEDVGTISVGILYLYIIISMGLLFLGYLFLNNKSVFISYTGLFLMILGFTFLYYDLHLSNLYAQTIAFNSGAGNTSSGIFIMIARFLKLAPYIIAGVIAFASVKLLRKAIKGRKSHDGWDDDDY